MSVVLIGGMTRLESNYIKEAKEFGVDLCIFNEIKNNIEAKIKYAEAVIIFTNKISHKARHNAFTAAKKQGVPVFMHHACGVCTLRECLNCVKMLKYGDDTGQSGKCKPLEQR